MVDKGDVYLGQSISVLCNRPEQNDRHLFIILRGTPYNGDLSVWNLLADETTICFLMARVENEMTFKLGTDRALLDVMSSIPLAQRSECYGNVMLCSQ